MSQLSEFAHSEAMDASEDVAAGEVFSPRLRILDAASYYHSVMDRHEPIDDIIAAIEEAFRRAGLKTN